MILIILQKKFVCGKWTNLGPNLCILITLDPLEEFFKILHSEKGQWVYEINNNGLYQKKFVQNKWAILDPKMAHPHNSGSALRVFFQFCRMKGANR